MSNLPWDVSSTGTATGTGTGTATGVAPGVEVQNIYLVSIALPDVPTTDPDPSEAAAGIFDASFIEPDMQLNGRFGIVSNASNRVSEWTDYTGNGNSPTQATALNKPLVAPDGEGVYFDNVADTFVSGYPTPGSIESDGLKFLKLLNSGLMAGNDLPWVVWVVADSVTSVDGGTFISATDPSPNSSDYSIIYHAGVRLRPDSPMLFTSRICVTERGLIEVRARPSPTGVTVVTSDGQSYSNSGDGDSGALSELLVGAMRRGSSFYPTAGLRGIIREIIVKQDDVSDADRQRVRDGLISIWGISHD
jgi:hypothetical protein